VRTAWKSRTMTSTARAIFGSASASAWLVMRSHLR
jgi:hypothetical protein